LDQYPLPDSPVNKLETAIKQYKGCYLNYANKFFQDKLDEDTEYFLDQSRDRLIEVAVENTLQMPTISPIGISEKVADANSASRAVIFKACENAVNDALLMPSWDILTGIFRNRHLSPREQPFFEHNMRWQQVDNGERIEFFDQLCAEGSPDATISDLVEAYIRVTGTLATEYVDRSAAEVLAFGDLKV
jgi:hypothetical protein